MSTDLMDRGRAALARYAWLEAQQLFRAALEHEITPEALEGLANAATWLYDGASVIDAHERAYHLYRERGNAQSAARMAVWLANDSLNFRGQPAIANGWLQRAHRLLDGSEPGPEHAFLAAMEAHITLMTRNDPVATRKHAADALRLARQFQLTDMEMLACAIEGLALVTEGNIAQGMSRLDEAATAVVAGEVQDFDIKSTALCYLIEGCTRARDYDRAQQWCARVEEEFVKWGAQEIFALCRPNLALVHMWRGMWVEAERELLRAKADMEALLPSMVGESVARLAELRWRQGRWEEADQLFRQMEHEGLAQPGKAELALGYGQTALAVNILERHLRRLPPVDRLERVPSLEMLVRASLAHGNVQRALSALAELESIAASVGTEPFKAAVHAARGRVLAAQGDVPGAQRSLEDARDLYQRSGAPFDAARIQLALADVLHSQGKGEEVAYEAMAALDAFKRLGAEKEAEHAEAVLGLVRAAHAKRESSATSTGTDLTRREVEVLRLLAAGKSNQEIAEHLVLSVRTVERHISTIYQKVGAAGKVARVAATAFALKHHIV